MSKKIKMVRSNYIKIINVLDFLTRKSTPAKFVYMSTKNKNIIKKQVLNDERVSKNLIKILNFDTDKAELYKKMCDKTPEGKLVLNKKDEYEKAMTELEEKYKNDFEENKTIMNEEIETDALYKVLVQDCPEMEGWQMEVLVDSGIVSDTM